MKKIALVLLALAITFPLVAGDLDGATVSISGDATTAFGIDLDTNATGFVNTLNAKLRLDFGLAADTTGTGMEEGAIYGEVKFDEINIRTQENNNADNNDAMLEMDIDLEYAKLIGPNWWVSFKAQDDAVNYENASHNGIIGIAAAWDKDLDKVKNDPATSGGFEVGITLPDIAAVELSLYSITDWKKATNTAIDNAYGVKAAVALKAVENLTLEAGANFVLGGTNLSTSTAAANAIPGWMDDMGTPADTTDDKAWTEGTAPTGTVYWGVVTAAAAATTTPLTPGFGGKLAYAISVGDITITPEVGADIKMLDGGGMDMAIGNGLLVALAGSELTVTEDVIENSAGKVKAWDDGVDSGLRLGWSYYIPNVGDAALGLMAHLGVSVIENLQLAVGFEAANILDTAAAMGYAVYADYTMGMAMPYFGLFSKIDGEMVIDAGLVLTDIFPHFSMAVRYNSGDLAAATPVLGVAKIEAKVSY
jgi:hypothetical protein